MSQKPPILKANQVLTIFLMILLAGLIGGSPYIYRMLAGDAPLKQLTEIQAPVSETPADDGLNIYRFPLVIMSPKYFFPTVMRGYDYYVQEGSPVYLPNFAHPAEGCNWAGVAGQVFDGHGNPITGYTVVVSGYINGGSISQSGVTGNAQVYGIGGYEIQIGSLPFSSTGALTLVLLDNNLKQVAIPTALTTYQDCQSNLVLINFARH